jgi:hypothetical protein
LAISWSSTFWTLFGVESIAASKVMICKLFLRRRYFASWIGGNGFGGTLLHVKNALLNLS